MTATPEVPMPEPDAYRINWSPHPFSDPELTTSRARVEDIKRLGSPPAIDTMHTSAKLRAYADARCAQESSALLGLIADIRAAAGDPTGKLDWPGLVEHVAKLQEERDALAEKVKALQDDLREVNRCNRPDCPHAGNYDAIDAAGGDPC